MLWQNFLKKIVYIGVVLVPHAKDSSLEAWIRPVGRKRKEAW